jgi:hypothetical protein
MKEAVVQLGFVPDISAEWCGMKFKKPTGQESCKSSLADYCLNLLWYMPIT